MQGILRHSDLQVGAEDRHVAACAACDLQPVCDGIYGDYAALFGDTEATPIAIGGRTVDPQHFTRSQMKRVHPDDLGWLEGTDARQHRGIVAATVDERS